MAEDIDAELARIEDELKKYEDNPTDISSPSTTMDKKDNIFVFARELIKTHDTKKFGFLDQKYIGIPKMAVNDYLEIADYCDVEGMNQLGDMFRQSAENVLSTSLSNKGFLLKILVTQIKKEQKVPTSPSTEKKGFWSSKKKEENQDEQI